MSRPEDESRTELAWREIVENYGERAVLDDPSATSDEATPAPEDPSTGAPASPASPSSADLPEHLRDDDEVERREQAIAKAERFRPPPAPPFPSLAPGSAGWPGPASSWLR